MVEVWPYFSMHSPSTSSSKADQVPTRLQHTFHYNVQLLFSLLENADLEEKHSKLEGWWSFTKANAEKDSVLEPRTERDYSWEGAGIQTKRGCSQRLPWKDISRTRKLSCTSELASKMLPTCKVTDYGISFARTTSILKSQFS
jgi:hypothetical protein